MHSAGDDAPRVVDVTNALVSDDRGLPLGVVGIHTDISHLKAMEHRLQDQNRELVEANRLKDEFLATMSHELRTPLTPIIAWTRHPGRG